MPNSPATRKGGRQPLSTLELCMRAFFLLPSSLFCSFTLLALVAAPASSAAGVLERAQAEQILQDTHSAMSYAGVAVEADFRKPENIVAAARWGAYDAKAGLQFAREQRREKGLPPGPDIILGVNGKKLGPEAGQSPDEAPARFQGLPQAQLFDEPPNNGSGSRTPYNVFVSREAAELAALRYTGHTLPADAVPRGILAAGVLAREEGYFFVVDGIGDNGREAVLDSITPKGEGYVLSGTLRDYFGDEGGGSKKTSFTLELAPGDAPGTWKRLSWTETDSK